MNRLLSLCLLIPVFCLSACGFHAVYGTHGGTPVTEQLNQIAIDNIPDRRGQILRNELIDKMYGKGRPAQPVYHLVVSLRPQEEDLGIQADATSTRTMLNMYADYSLQDMQNQEILKGTAHSVTSFNRLSDQYGNLAAEEGAVERTLSEVSEQVVGRLSVYFSEKAPNSSSPSPPTSLPKP